MNSQENNNDCSHTFKSKGRLDNSREGRSFNPSAGKVIIDHGIATDQYTPDNYRLVGIKMRMILWASWWLRSCAMLGCAVESGYLTEEHCYTQNSFVKLITSRGSKGSNQLSDGLLKNQWAKRTLVVLELYKWVIHEVFPLKVR